MDRYLMPFFEFSLMSQIQKLILCVEYFLMTKTSRNLWYCRTVQFIKIHFGYRSVHCTVFPNLRRMNVWTYCTWYSLKINAKISCDLKRNFQNIPEFQTGSSNSICITGQQVDNARAPWRLSKQIPARWNDEY